jgi:hypothetical protein
MMNNFKETTNQLIELAKVLNEFKSEAVQIRLLELLFDQKMVKKIAATDETSEERLKSPGAVEQQEISIGREIATEPAAANTQQSAGKNADKNHDRKKPLQKAQPVKIVRKRSTTRPGPSIILKQLIENKFFSDSRNIGDVVDYCFKMYNHEYKSTDLSGTLAKLAKDGTLLRQKNPVTNQFEYTLPE